MYVCIHDVGYIGLLKTIYYRIIDIIGILHVYDIGLLHITTI